MASYNELNTELVKAVSFCGAINSFDKRTSEMINTAKRLLKENLSFIESTLMKKTIIR